MKEEPIMLFDTVASMIAKQLKIDVSEITPDKRLVEDLKADSANVMVMIMDMEDNFNITVEDDAVNTLRTVGDVVKYIEDHQ
ncbi:MAG: acyl carrier protein [Clostridia bacterium]|nr:acyl carrier protein [Clostridia bacterium]